jgi:hypothetical protein
MFDVVSWISQYTKVRSKGHDNCYADCPFCKGESTLAISRRLNIFRCFRCYDGGHCREIWRGTCNLTKMMMLLENISYREAKEKVANLQGLTFKPTQTERPKIEPLFPESFPLKECHFLNPGRLMLAKRGVSHLVDSSSYCPIGTYHDRVILPTNYLGQLTGFEAKAIYPSQRPKALYPNWFRTGETFYTTQRWDESESFLVITESVLDAETLGINAIGLFGSYLKDAQFELLLKLRETGKTDLVWMLDSDAMQKSIRFILTKTLPFFTNYITKLPRGEDPNSLGRDKCWSLVSRAKEIKGEEDFLDVLNDM